MLVKCIYPHFYPATPTMLLAVYWE